LVSAVITAPLVMSFLTVVARAQVPRSPPSVDRQLEEAGRVDDALLLQQLRDLARVVFCGCE